MTNIVAVYIFCLLKSCLIIILSILNKQLVLATFWFSLIGVPSKFYFCYDVRQRLSKTLRIIKHFVTMTTHCEAFTMAKAHETNRDN